MKSASVIMPTFNEAPYLDLTLASYLGQSLPRFEIVIVDDGGIDGTRAVVDKYRRDLEIRHRRQAHAGRAVARNAGVDAASGELVIFSSPESSAQGGILSHGPRGEVKPDSARSPSRAPS